ncbi:MAG: 2,4-dienoyl-CoA reductase-like NADH-dependent reductase (Old Yellow Enzyme family) [Gammaproteobacteria bacterium]|jgi:2,4-dienoyl-CoA reductase-like NADH-dependent reductase (Old Yellow Enzyme family)
MDAREELQPEQSGIRVPGKVVPVPIAKEAWPTAEQAAGSRLFSPLRVGAFEARTRTWVPAMVPWRATDDGFVSGAVEDWYGRFADGRPGVLVAEATGIRDVPSGPLLRIGHGRYVPGLTKLTQVVRERSAGQTRFLVQLIDFLSIRRRPEREKYLRRFLTITDRHRSALAQIDGQGDMGRQGDTDMLDDAGVRDVLLQLSGDQLSEVLTKRELRDFEMGAREEVGDLHLDHIRDLPRVLPQLFADAAVRARQAGFDGVELHYAHAYTMASFLSHRNERSDGYGASREGRLRLAREVFEAVRRAVGDDFTIGCRLLGDEVIEGGSRVDDASFYSRELAAAGMDFISVSKGGKFEDAKQPKIGQAVYPYTGPSGAECMPTVRIDSRGPFGRNLSLSRDIRAAIHSAGLDTPVVGCGGINGFHIAEEALKNGDCDLVGAARQALADPDWWRKVELGQGALVRRCLYTNYCEALDQKHVEVTCQLWDRNFDDAQGDAAPRCADGKRRLDSPVWSPRPVPPSGDPDTDD